jgi:hypothetical protein
VKIFLLCAEQTSNMLSDHCTIGFSILKYFPEENFAVPRDKVQLAR